MTGVGDARMMLVTARPADDSFERDVMKFILATLFLGVALILGPIVHHAFYVSQFSKILPAALNGSATFFELPTNYYAVADGMGMLLTLTALILGIRMLLAQERDRKAKKAENKPVATQ